MGLSNKDLKWFENKINPYGLYLEKSGKGHIMVMTSENKRVGSISRSPTSNDHALENELKMLIRRGALPQQAWEKKR